MPQSAQTIVRLQPESESPKQMNTAAMTESKGKAGWSSSGSGILGTHSFSHPRCCGWCYGSNMLPERSKPLFPEMDGTNNQPKLLPCPNLPRYVALLCFAPWRNFLREDVESKIIVNADNLRPRPVPYVHKPTPHLLIMDSHLESTQTDLVQVHGDPQHIPEFFREDLQLFDLMKPHSYEASYAATNFVHPRVIAVQTDM
mmetsp:Transcript_5069/g.8007  ORF Transcript_5069/g.8007 Transcript_5069/m.8007 type:complete len:200 (-) Transcript_5069:908-1507(-)